MASVMMPAMSRKPDGMSTDPLRRRGYDPTLPRRLHQNGHIRRIVGQRCQFRTKLLRSSVPATQGYDRPHDVVFSESAARILAAPDGRHRTAQVGNQYDITAGCFLV